MKTTLDQLIEAEMAAAVERVVRLSQRAALAAFEAHFRSALPRASQTEVVNPPTRLSPAKKSRSSPSRRRSKAEIGALSKRFLEVIQSDPGQMMSVLAPRVGATAMDLQVPVAHLKAAKKLKTVGRRHMMRYFPVVQDVAA